MPSPDEWPILFEHLPAELADDFDPRAPWSLLGRPLEELLEALPSSAIESPLHPEVRLSGDRIVIGAGARIHPGASIEGPVRIGRDVEIRPGAYLRGGVWLGDGCVVGANVEVKRSIFFDRARAPHLNYVGDSILGRGVNLGAGTILSNLRHDGEEVVIPRGNERIPTGRRKLGAILGDEVLTGCNCMLNPGVIVGRSTHLYGSLLLRAGAYPADSIIKLRQTHQIVSRRQP